MPPDPTVKNCSPDLLDVGEKCAIPRGMTIFTDTQIVESYDGMRWRVDHENWLLIRVK